MYQRFISLSCNNFWSCSKYSNIKYEVDQIEVTLCKFAELAGWHYTVSAPLLTGSGTLQDVLLTAAHLAAQSCECRYNGGRRALVRSQGGAATLCLQMAAHPWDVILYYTFPDQHNQKLGSSSIKYNCYVSFTCISIFFFKICLVMSENKCSFRLS